MAQRAPSNRVNNVLIAFMVNAIAEAFPEAERRQAAMVAAERPAQRVGTAPEMKATPHTAYTVTNKALVAP